MKKLTDTDKNVWKMFVEGIKPLQTFSTPVVLHPPILHHIKPLENAPRSVFDLHGMTIGEAHKTALEAIETASNTRKSITIITGRSGNICKEFPEWMASSNKVRDIKTLNGGGAFKIYFKKKK